MLEITAAGLTYEGDHGSESSVSTPLLLGTKNMFVKRIKSGESANRACDTLELFLRVTLLFSNS